jgi:tetratricopeptide (TPR) repeat protein
MLAARRLTAVAAVLSLTALVAVSHVWGESRRDEEQFRKKQGSTDPRPARADADRQFAEDLQTSRFSDRPLVVYRTPKGETLFALQVKPKLDADPAAGDPCDYLVLVDTSASKAQGPLAIAQELAHALARRLGRADRMALWTINTEAKNLSNKGFGHPSLGDLDDAFKQLDKEFPAGAVNLKDGLAKVLEQGVEQREGRRRVIVFLGDGTSVAGPLDAGDRAALCDTMVKNRISFFAVPVGRRLDGVNLHGLATATGGKVVRLQGSDTAEKWADRLREAVAVPVVYPTEMTLSAGVSEALPTRLPPLRPDVPTLVVGRLDKADRIDLAVAGKVGDRDVRFTVSHKVPQPEAENFFLAGMVDQWRQDKERPALMAADRALAYAYDTNQMARADLLAKADWALQKDRLDAALRLFQQALELDPNAVEAKNGIRVTEGLRDGKLNRRDLREMLKPKAGDRVARLQGDGRVVHLNAEQLAQADARRQEPLAPPVAPPDPLAEVRARQAVADQQATQVVNDAIRQARRLVETDPDGAHDLLKRTLDGVRNNPDISPRTRTALSDRLERSLQAIDLRGATVRRNQAEDLAARAAAANRRDILAQIRLIQDQIRERMRVFHNLMDQAREQEAYRQANAIRMDLINKGLPVPPAVTAAYAVGLAGYNLREYQELRRVSEERWLATMLEVDRSHVPFPDEPPVEFPPAAAWKALSDSRIRKYSSTTFQGEIPRAVYEMEDSLTRTVNWQGIDDPKTTLAEALDVLHKQYPQLNFDVNEKAFENENLKDVLKTEVASPNAIPPMRTTLGTVLRKILARVPVGSGATFLIRPDRIEITTGTFASAEKAVRVYPVADLVLPIPAAVNQQQLFQQAQVTLGLIGGSSIFGALTFVGGAGFGFAAAGIGGFPAAGFGGFPAAGFGGFPAAGGFGAGFPAAGGAAGFPAGGFNQIGAMGGFMGNFQGAPNQGFGGVTGFGGQLGQFGNLGGQFGLQGGNQSQLLITLITQVVGTPRDWQRRFNDVTGQPLFPLDDEQTSNLPQQNNNLGYFPPAQALVVKGSALVHSRLLSNLQTTVQPGVANAMGALPRDNNNKDPLVLWPKDGGKLKDRKNEVRVGSNGDERGDDPEKDPKKRRKSVKPLDPKSIWQDALAKSQQEPGMIIATADFLAMNGKWDHAAEFLKADLRQGIVVEPWVYKSLAVALRAAGATPEEIERVEVSCADLQPTDANGYLEAARALAQDKRYGLALAFCRQAALLQPNVPHPYADAVGYAELARDAAAMEWAASHLLSQDWPVGNKELQARGVQKVQALARILDQADRKERADRLRAVLAATRRRDLVIKLAYEGDADLDLKVSEPTGTVCSALNRQTVGGGTLLGDSLAEPNREAYVASEAFPGAYVVTLERVWGRPLGDKAQLRVIRHQGTPQETEELMTVEMRGSRISTPVTVRLDDGRRKHVASVPPPASYEPPEQGVAEMNRTDRVLHTLRALADPEVSGFEPGAIKGGLQTTGRPVPPRPPSRPDDVIAEERTLYHTRVSPFFLGSADVTAQATISADRRYVRLSVVPFFNTITGFSLPTAFNVSIPGGNTGLTNNPGANAAARGGPRGP